ncbi:MAG: hypothetical protein WBA64_02245 [Marinomonas sp.]|uniref:hypothetical protein n=1 Tax=Marinomonas sp. TaxID=1904862 RepID=UPI003C70738C
MLVTTALLSQFLLELMSSPMMSVGIMLVPRGLGTMDAILISGPVLYDCLWNNGGDILATIPYLA